jgi:hypothetical protein
LRAHHTVMVETVPREAPEPVIIANTKALTGTKPGSRASSGMLTPRLSPPFTMVTAATARTCEKACHSARSSDSFRWSSRFDGRSARRRSHSLRRPSATGTMPSSAVCPSGAARGADAAAALAPTGARCRETGRGPRSAAGGAHRRRTPRAGRHRPRSWSSTRRRQCRAPRRSRSRAGTRRQTHRADSDGVTSQLAVPPARKVAVSTGP